MLICSLPASAQDIGSDLSEFGDGISNAFKNFGSSVAAASSDLYESVKGTIENDGKEVVDNVADTVKGWVEQAAPEAERLAGVISDWAAETAPKVGDYFGDLWNRITSW